MDGAKREQIIYVPFPKHLYDDVIRCSNGRIDPVEVAIFKLENWIESSLEWSDDWTEDGWEEMATHYAPHLLEERPTPASAKPLVWGGLAIPEGSDARMRYKRKEYFAKVQGQRLVDSRGSFTPSEWARVVAGSQRNAWRDIWFRFPGRSDFILADKLRKSKGQ